MQKCPRSNKENGGLVKKILFIDDDPLCREILILFINNHLSEIIWLEAGDGAEGLNIATKENPDLILLDLSLPVLDGKEVLENLKKRGINTRVIIISARNDKGSIIDFIKQGACDYITKDYITKPFLMMEVVFSIKKALEVGELINDNKRLIEHVNVLSEELKKTQIENKRLQKRIKQLDKPSIIHLWKEKLTHFEVSLAITSEPAQVFQLKKQIDECKKQIKRLLKKA